MPEWNGMKDITNGMEDILRYFHTNFILDFVHCIYRKIVCGCRIVIRGGVEDPTLEAKAKDSKENRRPKTNFSRTDPLEAKDNKARGQRQEGSRPKPRTKDTVLQVVSEKKS